MSWVDTEEILKLQDVPFADVGNCLIINSEKRRGIKLNPVFRDSTV